MKILFQLSCSLFILFLVSACNVEVQKFASATFELSGTIHDADGVGLELSLQNNSIICVSVDNGGRECSDFTSSRNGRFEIVNTQVMDVVIPSDSDPSKVVLQNPSLKLYIPKAGTTLKSDREMAIQTSDDYLNDYYIIPAKINSFKEVGNAVQVQAELITNVVTASYRGNINNHISVNVHNGNE